MKAIILAAGLGKRLMPLTAGTPKALVKINNTPLLELLINKLKQAGYNEIIINVHHFAEKIRNFLIAHHNFGIRIAVSDETDLLLDTGGGLKKASWFFNDNNAFLIHNVDILTDMNIHDMHLQHCRSGALATLAVMKRKSSRYFLFDNHNRLCGWEKTGEKKIICCSAKEKKLTPLAFSGIHVVNPSIFNLISEEGVFSLTDLYLRLAEKHLINAYNHTGSSWFDLGKPENIKNAELKFPFL